MSSWRDSDLPFIERARSLEAVRQIRAGLISVPLTCGECLSTSVVATANPELLECLTCGRTTERSVAHTIRRQKLAAIIREGVDVDVRRR